MTFARIIPLAALAMGAAPRATKDSFEAGDFNVTVALHNLGITVRNC